MRLLAPLLLLVTFAAGDNPYWYDKSQLLANRQLLVHLFEWKWTDIAKECENFLQYYGYGGVQVSPPNEHLWASQDGDVPWWVRYQPVSYKLQSRSGTQQEFADMVSRCNKVGVRIIVDVVANHMVGVGQKKGNGISSTADSDFNGQDGVETFAGVPYGPNDFNDARCHGDIQGSDYQNSAFNVKECRLVGLLDLNQGSDYVRGKIVGYLNSLVDLGVAGFRCDASKHMWPADLKAILDAVKDLRADVFGANQRPFAVHEVIDRGGEAVKVTDYLTVGRYTNFNFGAAVSSAARGNSDFKDMANLGPGYGYGNEEDNDVLSFIDNHDNQRDSSPYVVTYKEGLKYRMAVSYMLAWSYGLPRVMSSFDFDHSDQGPPSAGSGGNWATSSPTFNPDNTCDANSGWVCEHRWPTIRQMSLFRSAVQGRAVAEIVTDSGRLAFARESHGFFAVNNNGAPWSKNFQTTLPAGQYCDVYNGEMKDGACTAAIITVNENGMAQFSVPVYQCVAIHVNARLGGAPPETTPNPSWTKTVILLKRPTDPGEYVFIRGGNTNGHTCSPGPFQQPSDPCAVPIFHNTTTPFVYAEYRSWSQRDDYLDFEGEEEKQGTHDGSHSFGTPLAYSTNDNTAVEYQPYNTFGPDYWIAVLLVDCTKAYNGWIEFKGYMTPSVGWEKDVSQATCTGSVGGAAPGKSNNHWAKCGAVNVFTWNENSCRVDSL